MNLLISSTKLAEVARIAALAVRHQRDQKFPVLNCCRINAGGRMTDPGQLCIYGTNLDTGIAAWVDCDVIETGEVVVDAHKLAGVAVKLKGDVSISVKEDSLVIKCGRSRFSLAMLSTLDYPIPLMVDPAITATELSAADVMAIFAGAAAASAQRDDRIYLAGPAIFGEPTDFGHRLCGVGTDAVSLSYAATSAACVDMDRGVLVHRDTAKLAVRLFGETGAAMRLSDNLVQFETEVSRLTSKLIGAEPTSWRSLVPPAEKGNSALVSRASLVAALEQCAAVFNNLAGDAAKRAPSVRIRWDCGEDVCVSYGDIRVAPAALVTVLGSF